MSDQRKKIEEHALDTLLVEALGRVKPPDLTAPILDRLSNREYREEVAPIVDASVCPKPMLSSPAQSHSVAWTFVVTVAIAASIGLVVWLRAEPDVEQDRMIAANEPTAPDSPDVALRPEVMTKPIPDAVPTLPSRGTPLVIDSTNEMPSDQRPGDSSSEPSVTGPVAAVALVSQRFDSELVSYWNAIGIEPAPEADSANVIARLASILGVELPAEAVSDPEKLQAEFARDTVARQIALRWLQLLTERGVQRLDQESRDELIGDLADCFEANQPFDQTVANWISGQSPVSSSFYGAIAYAGQDAMARRLAALTMNVDLRCIRCHDSTIEGSGRQQDYWGFAALLSRGVLRDSEGRVTIDPQPNNSKPLFYELPDGRQRLAEPFVSSQWIDSLTSPPAESVTAWAAQLVGSEAVARGAVNSLWQLVHGQPLRGRVVDPITAPYNDSLDRIEEHLVQDLIRSQFDVARTLSLIVASPATRRSVPPPLLPENALVVSESDKRRAIVAVNAFAASLPRSAELPLRQRLDQAMRAIGGKLDQNGRPLLAQIGGPGDERSGGNADASSKPLAVDFPVGDESLPVHWLTLIEDEQSQIDHLGYLAGMQQLPEPVRATVKAMQQDERVSKQLMLNRVWWLVRP